MNKKIIVISYDDLWEGNDKWVVFEKFYAKFPKYKVTFFVNPGQCSPEFLKKIKKPWTELVYHAENHTGSHMKWSKEESKEKLLKYYDKHGFVKGFKGPGWRLSQNIIDACKELGFWIASISTIPVEIDKKFYTYYKKGEGLSHLPNYSQYYGHIQSHNFNENLKELEEHCNECDPEFRFVSEMLNIPLR